MSFLASKRIVIAAALSVVFSLSGAHACSGGRGAAPTLKSQIQAADAIFTGTITSVSKNAITVRIKRVFKGLAYKSVFVTIPTSSAACGIDRLKARQTITVYGQDTALDQVDPLANYRNGLAFSSDILAGTHLGSLTKAESRRLGKGFLPK